MIETVADLRPETLAAYEDVIDVRSPAEFEADRLPRAINLPVLSNEERARVGEIYVQKSKFLARRIGAGLIARNVAAHLETALAEKPAKWRPLLYCWRGGQRSNAMATILSQIGWRVGVVDGGYKTWRRQVVAALHGASERIPFILLDGRTGTAKSEILRRFAAQGGAVLDLEGLAAHRGSVFGGHEKEPQPSQTLFESRLFEGLSAIDDRRPIFVEAESSTIGRIGLPKRIWESMRAAPHVVVAAEREARADYLLTAYADIVSNPDIVAGAIERLRPYQSKKDIERWQAFAGAGDFRSLVLELTEKHYDPLYDRGQARRAHPPIETIRISDFGDAALDLAARRLEMIAAKFHWAPEPS